MTIPSGQKKPRAIFIEIKNGRVEWPDGVTVEVPWLVINTRHVMYGVSSDIDVPDEYLRLYMVDGSCISTSNASDAQTVYEELVTSKA